MKVLLTLNGWSIFGRDLMTAGQAGAGEAMSIQRPSEPSDKPLDDGQLPFSKQFSD